ncbi:MAG: mechanosensitive ion channel [Rhodospirillaceae bacterium]|nr:mechanosensitive ion channel [Rhodospirillaceae bacterium]
MTRFLLFLGIVLWCLCLPAAAQQDDTAGPATATPAATTGDTAGAAQPPTADAAPPAEDGAATAAAEAVPLLPDGVTPEQVNSLIATLEDEAARAELVANLRLLVAVEDSAEEEPGLGAEVIESLSVQLQAINGQLESIWNAIDSLPELAAWFDRQIGSEQGRARWEQIFINVAIVIGAGFLAWLIVRLALWPVRRRLESRRRETWLSRLAIWMVWTIGKMIPIVIFWVAATAAIAAVAPSYYVNLVVVALTQAVLIAGVIRTVAYTVLAPGVPNLRLMNLDDGTARYHYRWWSRIAHTAVFGYFIAETSFILGMPYQVRNGLLAVVGLAVTIMLIVLILGRRRGVAKAIRGSGESHASVRAARQWLASTWHVLAVIYVVAMYILWVMGIGDGFGYLLEASVLSVITMIICRLLILSLRRLLGTLESDDTKSSYVRGRTRMYVPIVRRIGEVALLILLLLVLAEIWGLAGVDWITVGWGRGILDTILTVAFVLGLALLAWEVIRGVIERFLGRTGNDGAPAHSARIRTVLPLMRSAALVVLATVATLVVLSEIGIDIAPLLAGAGVIGLAIGFGAQTLVQDVITGLFILLEDTISVGDVVVVGGNGGLVEAMSIRSIRMRDLAGNVYTIPFSQVSQVQNMTRDFSFYVFDIGIAYREDVDQVIEVVKQLGEEMEADLDYGREILAPIEILGLDSFGDSAVVIKARFKTKPIKQWYVGREFNRRMKKRFDELGIEIPFPHMTLYFGVDKAGEAPPANVTMDAPRLTEALAKGFGSRPSGGAGPGMQAGTGVVPPPPPPPAEPFQTPDVRGDSPAESSTGDTD